MMVGKAYVMKGADYDSWLEGRIKAEGRGSVDGSPAWRGRQLFLKLNCINCHNANDPEPTASARGPLAPNLENLYNQKVAVDNGAAIQADHQYLYDSIRDPMKNVRDGWKPIMPPFGPGRVTEEEMIDLLAYIKSLKPGDLPRRTDAFPAPVGSAPPAVPAGSMGGTNPR
jgi:cytochrome c oxidase subunit 2